VCLEAVGARQSAAGLVIVAATGETESRWKSRARFDERRWECLKGSNEGAAVKGLHVIVSIVRARGARKGMAAVNGQGGPLKRTLRDRSFVSQWFLNGFSMALRLTRAIVRRRRAVYSCIRRGALPSWRFGAAVRKYGLLAITAGDDAYCRFLLFLPLCR